MNEPIRHATPTPRMPKGRRRIDVAVSTGAADSPDAPYLRRWLAHQAARHRDLLLNIDAVSRIALDPVREPSRLMPRIPMRAPAGPSGCGLVPGGAHGFDLVHHLGQLGEDRLVIQDLP